MYLHNQLVVVVAALLLTLYGKDLPQRVRLLLIVPATTYSFIRRIGRITDDTTHPISSCSSTYYGFKVIKYQRLIMPATSRPW